MELHKLTIILRNYSLEDAHRIARLTQGLPVNLEVTLNTPHALTIIQTLVQEYGQHLQIGAGTVLTLEAAQAAVEHGARFILSPTVLSPEVLQYCQDKGVLTVPGALTPSEIHRMTQLGADYVKLFPASSLGYDYIKQVSSPLGRLRVMAVGGVTAENVGDFQENGIRYFGVGSAIFGGQQVETLSDADITHYVMRWLSLIQD